MQLEDTEILMRNLIDIASKGGQLPFEMLDQQLMLAFPWKVSKASLKIGTWMKTMVKPS